MNCLEAQKMIPNMKRVTKTGIEQMDLFTYDFQENRTIYLFDEINSNTAREIICQLRYLDAVGNGKDITLMINSPGGSLTDGLAIVDCMNACQSDIKVIATAMAASMGAFILACGTKGKRYATPNTEIMLHQPLGETRGQAIEIELAAKHISRTKERLYTILAIQTGKTRDVIEKDSDRDYWMTAKEALEYGLIDDIK